MTITPHCRTTAARQAVTGRHGLAQAAFAGAALIVSAGCPATASAAVSISGLESLGTKVVDAELSDMRGKFYHGGSVAYFGIAMSTSWQGSDGITTVAHLLFNVDFLQGQDQSGATPRLMISWSREGDPTMDVMRFGEAAQDSYFAVVSDDVAIPVGALSSVQGAYQANVIAGADNGARNAMSLAIVPIDMVERISGEGMQQVTSSQTQTFGNGDQVTFQLQSGMLALLMQSGHGPDRAQQSFDGNRGQFGQQILLNSSNNLVANDASIVIGINSLGSLDSVRVQEALSAMKGNGF